MPIRSLAAPVQRSGAISRLSLMLALSIGGASSFAAFDAANAKTAIAEPASTAAAPAPLEGVELAKGVEMRTLENGLRVVAIPDRRAPVVTHMLWYHVGAADEPRGKSGIAHYLEHLLFKGTPNVPAGVFSDLVASVGGKENAFTGQDYTAYFQRVTPDVLGQVMEFEADRMVNLELTEEMIATERQVILEERAGRIGSSPGAELGEAVNATLFQNHPYGTPIIGWPQEISGLTAEDALEFYQRFYRPDNATLVVAGDVDPEDVFALAERTYGALVVAGEAPTRDRVSEPDSRITRTVELADPRVSRESVSLTWLAPATDDLADGEGEALELLAEVLSGSATSRIYRELVVEKEIAASAGAYFDGSSRDASRFGLSVTPADGVSIEEAEDAIRAELARIAEEGVLESELDRARDRLLVSTVFARDSQATMARIFGANLALGSSLEDIRSWPDRLAAVSPDDVAKAAKRFGGDGFVRAILRPAERPAAAALREIIVPSKAEGVEPSARPEPAVPVQ